MTQLDAIAILVRCKDLPRTTFGRLDWRWRRVRRRLLHFAKTWSCGRTRSSESVLELQLAILFIAVRRDCLVTQLVISLRSRVVPAKSHRRNVAPDLCPDWIRACTDGFNHVVVRRNIYLGARNAVAPNDAGLATFLGNGSAYTVTYGGQVSHYLEAPSLS
jgi:hypothetical protein